MYRFSIISFAAGSQLIGVSLYVMCSFAMGVVLLRETQSLWVYSGNALICTAMMSLMGPIFGNLSDRFGRTILSGILAAVSAIWAAIALMLLDTVPMVLIAMITSFFACAAASCLGVVSISTPGLQAKRGDSGTTGSGLGKIQVAEQVARIAAPLLLLVYSPLSLQAVLIFICLFSVIELLISMQFYGQISALERSISEPGSVGKRPVRMRDMLKLAITDPVLKIFAPYLAVSTACVELAVITLTPIVLSFATESQLGLAFSLANASAIAGSLLLSRQRPEWTRYSALKAFLIIEGVGSILIGIEALTSSIVVFTAALMAGFLIMPTSLVAAQVVWLGDAPRDQQGVLSGLERFASWCLVPFAILLGPLLAPPLETGETLLDIEVLRTIAFGAAFGLFASTLVSWLLLITFGSKLRLDLREIR